MPKTKDKTLEDTQREKRERTFGNWIFAIIITILIISYVFVAKISNSEGKIHQVFFNSHENFSSEVAIAVNPYVVEITLNGSDINTSSSYLDHIHSRYMVVYTNCTVSSAYIEAPDGEASPLLFSNYSLILLKSVGYINNNQCVDYNGQWQS